MILIGQFDSPFVRRVGIALRHYDLAFEHRPWSVFRDADEIKAFNPLIRVPTLVLPDGLALVESHAILDYLESRAPQGQALFPASEPERHQVMRIAALATGAADKAVSLFYEMRLHKSVSELWVGRCKAQITATLALLEKELATRNTEFWFGGKLSHADITCTCALRFITEAHPGLVRTDEIPALTGLAARLEATPVFQEIAQPFLAPA